MRSVLGVGLFVALLTPAVAGDDKKDRPDPKKLVGAWEPKEARKGGRRQVEFTTDGKLTVTVDVLGDEGQTVRTEKAEGTYTLVGNRLKLKLRFGKKEVAAELAVLRLTDEEWETEDAKGKRETMTRVLTKQ